MFQFDKLEHFVFSQVIDGAIFSTVYYYNENKGRHEGNLFKSLLISTSLTLFIGGVKEVVWDGYLKHGVASGLDFWADVVGVFTFNIGAIANFTMKFTLGIKSKPKKIIT